MTNDTIADVSAFIDTATWLSSVFSAPMSVQQLTHSAAAPGQAALNWMGEQLKAQDTTNKLSHALIHGTPESVATDLQRNYTMLFEGIFRHKSVLPYESAWRQSDIPPAVDMDATLRALDLHVSEGICEPSDHLAIELAALAAALLQEQRTTAIDLVCRLHQWVPEFSAALAKRDPNGFYAAAGELLLALIREMTKSLVGTKPVAAYLSERHEGVFV